jgi:signal peptidase II
MGKIWLVLFIILLDQISKYMAVQFKWSVINQGISFNWFSAQPSWLIIILLFLILGFLLLKFLPREHPAVFLILAGAISNLLDRIVWGGVLDWLPVPFFNLTNNFADWAIFFGVIWFVFTELCKFPLFSKTKI